MLVAITGLKRSGKDTVGAYLETKGFHRTAFAAPMKIITRAIDPILDTYHPYDYDPTCEVIRLSDALQGSDEDAVKAQFPEYRRFLQRLGTEAFRSFDEKFWINWCFNELDKLDPRPQHAVITDCRFPNEVEAVRSRGGLVWRIEREGVDTSDLHPSEAFIQTLEVDATIENNGTLEDLYASVDRLL